MILPADLAALRQGRKSDPQRLWAVIDELENQLGIAMRAIGIIDVARACDDRDTIRARCWEVTASIGNAEPWMEAEALEAKGMAHGDS